MPQIGQKWPKFRFFAFDCPPGRCSTLECINERCARARRFQKSRCDRRTRRRTPSFLGKTDVFLPFFIISRFCRLIVVLGGAADPSIDHISAISKSRGIIFSRSSSVWLSGQPGIPGLFSLVIVLSYSGDKKSENSKMSDRAGICKSRE